MKWSEPGGIQVDLDSMILYVCGQVHADSVRPYFKKTEL